MALRTDSPNSDVRSVAICAGSGGSVLLGVDADVYFTGEMSHVRSLTLFEFLKMPTCCINSMKYLPPLRQGETLYFVGPSNTLLVRTLKILFLGGHTNTERGYLPVLASKLQAELAAQGDEKDSISAKIHISQEDRHPLDFV